MVLLAFSDSKTDKDLFYAKKYALKIPNIRELRPSPKVPEMAIFGKCVKGLIT